MTKVHSSCNFPDIAEYSWSGSSERKHSELVQMTQPSKKAPASRMRLLDTEVGRISFEISPATISLASRLSLSVTSEEVVKALLEGESQIEEWNSLQKKTSVRDVLLQVGVRVSFHFGQ